MIPNDQTPSGGTNYGGGGRGGYGMGNPFDAIGQKLGQFGHWAGDQLGLNPTEQVKPSYAIDYGRMDQDRAGQMDLLRQYQAMAAGNGPSLAQGQLQQATDRNISQAMALGAAQQGQGLGYSSALRNIADQSAAARQQAAGQSAMMRNYEQMQAMGAQGGLLGQMGGQSLAREGLGAGTAFGYDQMNANIAQQNAQRRAQFFGSIINAGGGMIAGNLQKGMGAATGNPMAMAGSSVPDISEPIPYSAGGCVPGYARGGQLDSRSNDTVPAMLSPGEIVIPRSITMAPDAAERARLFVEQVMKRRAAGPMQSEHPAVRAQRKAA